jgi:hypothetical protein
VEALRALGCSGRYNEYLCLSLTSVLAGESIAIKFAQDYGVCHVPSRINVYTVKSWIAFFACSGH